VSYSKIKQAEWPPSSADAVCRRSPLTLTFDRLTLKLIVWYASHIKGGEPSFQSWARYAFGFSNYSLCTRRTERRTDRRTDGQKQRLLPHSLRSGGGHNKPSETLRPTAVQSADMWQFSSIIAEPLTDCSESFATFPVILPW